MQKTKQKQGRFLSVELQVLLIGCFTGVLVGTVITFYNILGAVLEAFSTDIYAYVRQNWMLIPLFLFSLCAVAFAVGVAVQLAPALKGSGLPQTEGVARGFLKQNWFVVLCGKFALSLLCIFSGLATGGEGPSIHIGGAIGDGASRLFTRTGMLRRYQITGGACAGLAVAFNAPLTGMAFAFEETHKKFSPEVFICAFSAVTTGVITRNLIRGALNLSTGVTFTFFSFVSLPYTAYGYLALAAAAVSLLGAGFYYAIIGVKKWMDRRVTFLKNRGKMLFPFIFAGAAGLLAVYAIGGGHALIESLGTLGGTQQMQVQTLFALGIELTLLLVLLLRVVACVLNMACGVPGGVFIPMLAIGAVAGAMFSLFFTNFLGMDGAYSDLLVMVCMAAFFTCVVRAPITAIIMVFELTGSISAFLPVVIGVAIGYMTSEVLKTKPIYEELLDEMLQEKKKNEPRSRISCTLTLRKKSAICGMSIRDVLWPPYTAVKKIERAGQSVPPAPDEVLKEEDVLTIESLTANQRETEEELVLLLGDDFPPVQEQEQQEEGDKQEQQEEGNKQEPKEEDNKQEQQEE